jgi:hypothetical protein
MTDKHEHELVTRYFDGEIGYADLPPELQRDADALSRMLEPLRAERTAAPAWLKPVIMARVRHVRLPASQRIRRWLTTPHFGLRPAVALTAAAGALLVALVWPSLQRPPAGPAERAPIIAGAERENLPPASAETPPADPQPEQALTMLEQRLDSATLALIRPMLAAASRESLPTVALERRALEGAAKASPAPQIAAAVDQLAGQLRAARALLREFDTAAEPTDDEILAAAYALELGVPGAGITALARGLPRGAEMDVPLALLGDLVSRGISAVDAGGLVTHLVHLDVPAAQLTQIPPQLDVTLRVETRPSEALVQTLRGMGLPEPPRRPDIPQ